MPNVMLLIHTYDRQPDLARPPSPKSQARCVPKAIFAAYMMIAGTSTLTLILLCGKMLPPLT
jgi:hypothetical protein